jgi:hypothetical protein
MPTRVKVAVLGVVVASVSACGNGTYSAGSAPVGTPVARPSAPALPANAVKGRLHTGREPRGSTANRFRA